MAKFVMDATTGGGMEDCWGLLDCDATYCRSSKKRA